MNYEEFSAFLKSVYVALPDVWVEVKYSTEDVSATHRSWFKVLERFELAECQAVLSAWLDGREPVPVKKSEQRQIVFVVRQLVLKNRQRKGGAGQSDYVARRSKARGDYQPSALGLLDVAEAFRAGLAAKRSVLDGVPDDVAREQVRKAIDSVG